MSVMSVRTSILATVDEVDMWRFDAQFYFALPQSAEAVERIASRVDGVVAVSSMPEYRSVLTRADGTESEASTSSASSPTRTSSSRASPGADGSSRGTPRRSS
jgi:hypothetical protein